MVDWMVEVLTTFKCSEQSFFLCTQILDRFFKNSERNLSGGDLHLTGITCMLVSTKYEDVIPLLMRTILHKIGHDKFSLNDVQNRELEILKALSFKIGAPTIKEFLDSFIEELGHIIP